MLKLNAYFLSIAAIYGSNRKIRYQVNGFSLVSAGNLF